MSIPQEHARGGRGPIRSSQNFAAGLFLVAIAALALWLTRDLPQGHLNAMGPAMLPDWLAYGVGFCGFVLIGSSFLRSGEPMERWSLRGQVFVVLAVLAFAITIRPFAFGPLNLPGLGLVVAGPLAITIGGYAAPEARFGQLLFLSLSLTPFCMVLFGDILNLPIPIFPQDLTHLFPDGWTQKGILRFLAALMALAAVAAYFAQRGRKTNKIDVVDHSGRI